jgi:peptidoglycan/LPS O-acetylase OafA/YrhL
MTMIEKNPSRSHWLDSWHVNPSANREYDFIDGLRGVAILMVLCCHHLYVNPKSGPAILFLGQLFGTGGHGVELFFTLSGFLISWPFWKRKFAGAERAVPTGYARRRFWKIYPPLALSVIIFTPIYIFLHKDWSYLPIAAQWLAGIAFILPVSGKFNPVMWTLVIEAQFYMVLPLIFLCLKRISPKSSLWIITLLFLVVPAVFRALSGLSASFFPDINSHFPSTLDAFCLGILVAGLDSQGSLKQGWAVLGKGGVVLWPMGLLLLAWMDTYPEYHSPALVTAENWLEKIGSGCLLCYVANPQLPIARLLCAPWLRWCGIVSYEWYLFHQPIALWSRGIFGPAGGNPVKYAVIVGGSFLFSTILSALVYRFFSLPILKYGRGNRNLKLEGREEKSEKLKAEALRDDAGAEAGSIN